MDELAEAEKINGSYLSRITRLAYLSPRIIDAILQGEHPPSLTLKDLMAPFPLEWGRRSGCSCTWMSVHLLRKLTGVSMIRRVPGNMD